MSIYQNQNAYLTGSGSFLPGEAIFNDEMESRLGLVDGKPSRYRSRILKSNGIKSRYYAIDKDGKTTHLTGEMAAKAIVRADHSYENSNDFDMIAVGTTFPDLLAPGIASMVHGSLGGNKNSDILSAAGICGAGAAALKAATMSVISGQHNRAVACGVERSSALMRGQRFEKESKTSRDVGDDVAQSFQYFHADFLRWMLSDGAGAVVISNQPRKGSVSLKVEWIETASYANELDTCMYLGTSNPNDLKPSNTWIEQIDNQNQINYLLLRQDTKLLADKISVVVDFLVGLREKFGLPNIDWFLPHISSFFFLEKFQDALKEKDFDLPADKWFTNLETIGNTGSASIFIMLDELMRSNRIKPGEKLLLMVPESGRFSVTYALVTAEQH